MSNLRTGILASILSAQEGCGMTDLTSAKPFPANWCIGTDYVPNDHLMDLRGKSYLQVADRIFWFCRDQRALIAAGLATCAYVIKTELVEHDRERGWAHFKTYVRDVLGNEATMYGSEDRKDFGDYLEKSSTKATGRALAMLGYGTTAAPELDEGERVVDSPVARPAGPQAPAAASNGHTRPVTAASAADKTGRDWVALRGRMKRTLGVSTLTAADAICQAACGRTWEQTTDADYERVFAEVARLEAEGERARTGRDTAEAATAAARVPTDALQGATDAGGRH
jgi:hypothetical protein